MARRLGTDRGNLNRRDPLHAAPTITPSSTSRHFDLFKRRRGVAGLVLFARLSRDLRPIRSSTLA
jgi:hypothetical protein